MHEFAPTAQTKDSEPLCQVSLSITRFRTLPFMLFAGVCRKHDVLAEVIRHGCSHTDARQIFMTIIILDFRIKFWRFQASNANEFWRLAASNANEFWRLAASNANEQWCLEGGREHLCWRGKKPGPVGVEDPTGPGLVGGVTR